MARGISFIARKSLFLLCFLLLSLILPCSAQLPKGNPHGRQVGFEWVLNQQQIRTGYGFLYNARIFRKAPLIDIDTANALIKKDLKTCLAWLNVSWYQIGITIVITRWKGPRPLSAGTDTTGTNPASKLLDEVVVAPYQYTTRRRTTANIFELKAEELSYLPANNLLDAMEGEAPGASIRHFNGVPASAFEVLLGGRHSLQQGNDPLYVIDGVPLATNGLLSTIGSGSAQGPFGASALNGFPHSFAASIGVMHDPSATALYGSRASNGVIIATLREGRSGPWTWTAEVNSGVDRVVRTSTLLNTPQFLQLRKEAILNDKLPVNDATLPERKWGANRYTDFKHTTIGGIGWVRNARIDLTGGSTKDWFLFSGRYHRESTVFPDTNYDQHLSLYGNFHHQSENKQLRLSFSALYDQEDIRLPQQDYSQFQYLAPNALPFTNAAGQAQWGDTTTPIINIPAQANNTYHGSLATLLGHGKATYQLGHYFSAEAGIGYNGIFTREQGLLRMTGQTSLLSPPPVDQSTRANNDYSSGIAEATVRYFGPLGPQGAAGQLDALVGVTYQDQQTKYSSRKTPPDPGTTGAATASVDNRYKALFGRATYVFRDSYILSASWRRDGSTKFGPGYRYGNFYSVGAGWIFRQEDDANGFSFGKIKGSFGTTGNDQINPKSYDTAAARMAHNNLNWELSRQAELGLDLGFHQNDYFFSVNAYRSWTENQLILLPRDPATRTPAHFSSRPAEVLNEGLEFVLAARELRLGRFRWSTRLTLTVPKNLLKSFPRLDSALASTVVVGRSLTVTKGYHFTGVDPQTGLYTFQGVNLNGPPGDGPLVPSPSLDPKYHAGWSNTVRYGNWELHIFFDWRRQNGVNPLFVLNKQNPPGMEHPSQLSNGPVEWLHHWQQPGDHSTQQRLTTGNDGQAMTALQYYLQSDAAVTGASYLRVKTVALYYRLNPDQLKKLRGVGEMNFYLRGENLLTVSRFPVTDPETQDPTVLPPMRILTAGFAVSFKSKAGHSKDRPPVLP